MIIIINNIHKGVDYTEEAINYSIFAVACDTSECVW